VEVSHEKSRENAVPAVHEEFALREVGTILEIRLSEKFNSRLVVPTGRATQFAVEFGIW
jgi:hypothetical protein